MFGKKNTLEKKLQVDGPGISVDKKTDLREFTRIVSKRYHSEIKGDLVALRTVCMLGYLYDRTHPTIVPRQIHTVGELYSFTEKEILGFRGYGRKTWLKLNEILTKYRLPPLKLPREYTNDL